MTLKLGQLKNLKLKSVWNHEEHDFTPWLAEESHLSALSDAIGMGLQLAMRENAYSLDVTTGGASC